MNDMRIFNYRSEALRLLNFESINNIGLAYRFMERHSLAEVHIPCMLEEMKKISLVHNIAISLSTDYRVIDKARIIDLVLNDSIPYSYEEKLALGYQKAFTAIHTGELESDDVFTAAKKLHQLLFSQLPDKQTIWRTSNEPVYQKANDYLFKCQPIPATDALEAFERICSQCQWFLSNKVINVLYIIPVFIVDITYIQPFEKNSQILVKLLLLHILHNAGFPIFEYICLEYLLLEDSVELYSSIEKGMLHWDQEINDYRPIFDFWMNMVQKACCFYNKWISDLNENVIIKQKIIEKYIKAIDGEVTKQMIRDFFVNISDATISLTLSSLLKTESIEKLHKGRSTAYRYIGEK